MFHGAAGGCPGEQQPLDAPVSLRSCWSLSPDVPGWPLHPIASSAGYGSFGCCWSWCVSLGPCRWSTGVIMYTLLAGSPPFWHRKQMLMLRMIMNGDYQFGSPEWDDRSDTVKDLVGAEEWGNTGGRRWLGRHGINPVPSCRSPGSWWWTHSGGTQRGRHWHTLSSSSTTWRRSDTSAPSGNSR